MTKYCPECGTKLDNKNITVVSSKKESPSEIKPIHAVVVVVAFVIFLFLIISISNGSLQNLLIPSEKPNVDVQSCNVNTGWDITKGYYATFTTSVKNTGNGWAIACTAQVTVTDQNGEIEYSGIIPIGRQTSPGTYSPLYENEQKSFYFTADHEMGDSPLRVNILLTWVNTDGDKFSERYSDIFYI